MLLGCGYAHGPSESVIMFEPLQIGAKNSHYYNSSEDCTQVSCSSIDDILLCKNFGKSKNRTVGILPLPSGFKIENEQKRVVRDGGPWGRACARSYKDASDLSLVHNDQKYNLVSSYNILSTELS